MIASANIAKRTRIVEIPNPQHMVSEHWQSRSCAAIAEGEGGTRRRHDELRLSIKGDPTGR